MRLTLICIGQGRGAPEHALAQDYVARIGKAGAPIGISDCALIALRDKPSQNDKQLSAQATRLDTQYGRGMRIALDEGGATLSSTALADRLGAWAESGSGHIAFMVGGADGLTDAIRARADFVLSLGAMTWPHMLVRAMLAEQLWRALSIRLNHPYHRA